MGHFCHLQSVLSLWGFCHFKFFIMIWQTNHKESNLLVHFMVLTVVYEALMYTIMSCVTRSWGSVHVGWNEYTIMFCVTRSWGSICVGVDGVHHHVLYHKKLGSVHVVVE